MKKIKLSKKIDSAIIADSNLFSYIDSDFRNYKADEALPGRKDLIVEPKKLEKNSTYKEIFNPETDVMTQSEILDFVEHNREFCLANWSTQFLFRSYGNLFVAGVFKDGGALYVSVRRFSGDRVWNAGRGRVFVFPQQSTSTLGETSLGSSDTLTLESLELKEAIDLVKSKGYTVFKEY